VTPAQALDDLAHQIDQEKQRRRILYHDD